VLIIKQIALPDKTARKITFFSLQKSRKYVSLQMLLWGKTQQNKQNKNTEGI